jgi:hypothetical protein
MITTLTIISTRQGPSYEEARSAAAFSMLDGFVRFAGNLLRAASSASAVLGSRPVQTARA